MTDTPGKPFHLLVIGGPTATGKTALAAELAHTLGAEVISADSRQVYRGLDLGTGKDLEQFAKYRPAVPYHLIDIADPREVYTLFQYQADCFRILEELAGREGSPGLAVMAGGTGLYMESVLRRYRIANVPENPDLRRDLEARPQEELSLELRALAPELAGRTDLTSKKRIIRALEILAAGPDVERSRLPAREFAFTVFATAWEREELRARIDRRLEERLAAGMVAEVEGLLRQGVPAERLRLMGMEYREITEYLQGGKTFGRMVEDLRHEIHLLAKRQETYFRGMPKRGIPIQALRPGDGVDAVLSAWRAQGTRP